MSNESSTHSVYSEIGYYRIDKYTGLESTKVVFSGSKEECEEYIEKLVNKDEPQV